MKSEIERIVRDVPGKVAKAVRHYWVSRESQTTKQQTRGAIDQGLRGAATGGAQMDGFSLLFSDLAEKCGVPRECICLKKRLELPGYFRPTKEWDFLIVKEGRLLCAMETKSHAGPSFGNNFNNRTEEAMGSALDIWTAFREGAFQSDVQPFLGYLFLLEDCPASNRPVKVREPHFEVFPEFQGASYRKRYEVFCRKLMLERHYTCTAFITSDRSVGMGGLYTEPCKDVRFELLARRLVSHLLSQA